VISIKKNKKTMKKLYLLLLATAVTGLLQACSGHNASIGSDSSATKTDSPKMTAKTDSASTGQADTAFAKKAAIGGMAEVALGDLAAGKGLGAKVKAFGKMMMLDHGKANAELTAIAQKKHISLPSILDAGHRTKNDSLSKLTGKAFDKAYVSTMIADHQQTLTLMRTEAQSGTDPELKAFAAKTAPVVQMHLTEITKIHDSMK
jgi:putative membrane protein